MTDSEQEISFPRLVLIADGFTSAGRQDTVLSAARVPGLWIHLRDHEARSGAFHRHAEAMVNALRRLEVEWISVNGELEVARELEVGLHTGTHGPPVERVRAALTSQSPIGVSVHDEMEARAARQAGADYAFVSPVYETDSKPGEEGIEPEGLKKIIEELRPVPAYALGGITPERVGPCLEAGAYGVAMLSGIMDAADPEAAAREYQQALEAVLS